MCAVAVARSRALSRVSVSVHLCISLLRACCLSLLNGPEQLPWQPQPGTGGEEELLLCLLYKDVGY